MRNIAPSDRVIRAAFWKDARIVKLEPVARLSFLWLVACADGDGIAPYSWESMLMDGCGLSLDPASFLGGAVLSELEEAGLVVGYQSSLTATADEPARWVWVPMLGKHQPSRGEFRPTRNGDRPPPPQQLVRDHMAKRLGRDPTEAECRAISPRSFGLTRQASTVATSEDTQLVWEAWRSRQQRPNACKLSLQIRSLIANALKQADAATLAEFIAWAHESSAPGPRFWQGHNRQRRRYLGLTTLLQGAKLQERLQAMARDKAKSSEEEEGSCGGIMAQRGIRKRAAQRLARWSQTQPDQGGGVPSSEGSDQGGQRSGGTPS